MRLYAYGSSEEALLFELIGIQDRKEGNAGGGLFIGTHEPVPGDIEGELYLVLPDPDHPLEQTKKLAELLGRAVGQGKIQL